MTPEERSDPFATYFAYPGEASVDSGLVFLPDRGEEDWGRVLDHAEVLRFAPGAEVIRAGDDDRALYIVVAGTLEIVLFDEDGGAHRYGTIGPHSVTGEMSFLDGRPRAATVRAIGDSEVVRMSYEAYEALATRYPELGRSILLDLGRILAARLRRANEIIARVGA